VSVRRRVITAVLTAAAVTFTGLAAAAPASADTSTVFPWHHYGHVLADAHGHVYVTGGAGTDGIWVRNANGSANTTITGEAGASGMTLSADGATLYVGLLDGAAIAAISTTSLAETARYATASHCPDSLALLGSALWFSSTCSSGPLGGLGVVDLGTTAVDYAGDSLGGALLLAVPGDPTVLLAGVKSQSPANVYRFSVSGSTLTQTAYFGGFDGADVASNLQSMAIDPDGTHVILACGSPYKHLRLLLSDLTGDGSYASDTYPDSVATSTVQGGIVAAGSDGTYHPDIWIYRAGSLVRTYTFPDELVNDGLALAPDGLRLYAVTAPIGTKNYVFRVLDGPAKTPSSLTVVAPATGKRGLAYSVSGVLSTNGTPVVGATVSLKRTDLAGTKTFNLTTGATGGYAHRDVPAVGGPVTWAATWVGDTTNAAVTTTRVVTIARVATALTIKASASIYSYGAKATVTVHLGATYNRRDVYVYARPLGTSVTAPGTLVAHVKVNSAGNAVVSYVMKRRTTFTARFVGDYRSNVAARAVSPYVRAKVSVTLAGYYGKSGSTYLYRGKDPAQMISVAPNRAGTCFNTLVQANQHGGWQTIASLNCGILDSTSRGYAVLVSNRAPGILVRIHASIPNDSASQTLGATSAWVYLKFA
jgi:hypothetical protein